ncbi:hypothetical protein PHOSAC3_120678 [Mesotoga infera]|nr:hypothetical protein PHOSAC3_120678 [Mesotoga infera]
MTLNLDRAVVVNIGLISENVERSRSLREISEDLPKTNIPEIRAPAVSTQEQIYPSHINLLLTLTDP